MAECSSCGRRSTPDAAFCGRCGSPLGAGEAGEPVLLDETLGRRRAAVASAGGSVRSGPSGRVVAACTVALLAIATIAFGRGGSDTPDDVAPIDPVGNLDVLRRSGASSEPESGLDDGIDDRGDDGGGRSGTDPSDAGESGDGGDGSTIIGTDPAGETRSLISGSVDGSTLLGVETGLGLIVGSDVNDLTVIDLDTGGQRSLGIGTGSPIGMVDATLIVQRDGAIYGADLAREQPEAVRLTLGVDLRGGQAVVAGGLIWVVAGFDVDDRRLRAFDPAGAIALSIDLPEASTVFIGSGLPELVDAVPGGIYRVEEGTFQRVSDGVIVAAGERLALAQECDEVLNCGVVWYRKADWSKLSFPIPERRIGLVSDSGTIVGDDRWLLILDDDYRANSGSVEVVEVATGLTVARVFPPRGRSRFPVASPDGRWLATFSPRLNPVLVDLDGEPAEFELDGPRVIDGQALLIERSALPELFAPDDPDR